MITPRAADGLPAHVVGLDAVQVIVGASDSYVWRVVAVGYAKWDQWVGCDTNAS